MIRLRSWGLLLAIGLPLLIFFSWSQLGGEKSRVNLERFETWSEGNSTAVAHPLVVYFLKNTKLAGPGDVAMPAVPKKSGIKAWSVQADTTLLVELDAKVDGRPVLLKFVPVVRSASSIFYDCVSAISAQHVGRICQVNVVPSIAAIPGQLAENAKFLQSMPPVMSASGVALHAGSVVGSVVLVPQNSNKLNDCGFQCVKPQNCATPRPLACSKTVDEGNSRWLDIAATDTDFFGNSLATRSDADKACEQSLGAGYRVLNTSSISGRFKLTGGNEYWVHDEMQAEKNCWKTDYP